MNQTPIAQGIALLLHKLSYHDPPHTFTHTYKSWNEEFMPSWYETFFLKFYQQLKIVCCFAVRRIHILETQHTEYAYCLLLLQLPLEQQQYVLNLYVQCISTHLKCFFPFKSRSLFSAWMQDSANSWHMFSLFMQAVHSCFGSGSVLLTWKSH